MQGVDLERLDDVFARAAEIPGMRSLLVAQRGDVVREAYFGTGAAHFLNDVRSITKSFMSALVGIAIGKGLIRSVHDPISDYLAPVVDLDERLGAITIDNLLTMRAGHAWDVFAGADFRAYAASRDQLVHVLRKPLVEPPGERWVYSDGTAHIVSAVLSEATGLTALSFAEQHLFAPLGIRERRSWSGDVRGYSQGGVGLAVRTREMLTFAMLYLNGGRHGDQQIIPEEWVKTSTEAHVVGVADEMPALDGSPAWPVRFSYGYFWWLGTIGPADFVFAQGFGGQFILLVPSLELVIVSTSDHWTLEEAQNWKNAGHVLRLIIGRALPAAGAELPPLP